MVNVENLREFLPLRPPPVLRAAAAAAIPVISLRTVVVPQKKKPITDFHSLILIKHFVCRFFFLFKIRENRN